MSDPSQVAAQVAASVAVAQAIHGPILAGLFFNLLLLGISITQTYFYFGINTSDKKWVKHFILMLFVMDIINSVFDMIYVYETLINHNGDIEAMSEATWSFATDPMLTAIIGASVQLFFGWRVKVLTGSTIAAIVIWFFAIIQALAGIATGVAVLIVPHFLEFRKFQQAVIVWLAGSALCDVLITFALVFYLRKHKTGYTYTDDIVDRIIRMTVQTGMVTSVVACIDLILFLASPKGYHLTFNFMLAKLYTNSLLSSLNARKGWAFSSGGSQPSGDRPSRSVGVSGGRRPGNEVINLGQLGSVHTRPQVFVAVESHQVVDHGDVYDKKVDFSTTSDGSRSSKIAKQEPEYDQSFVPDVHAA